MKLTILGSGTFFVGKTVTASSFLLEIGEKLILIDCGPGTLVKLAQAGYTPEDIDYVFITHFHPDHSSDLFPLFMNYRLKEIFFKDEKIVYPLFCGPEGIDKFMSDYSKLTELHAYDGWVEKKVQEFKPKMEFENFTVSTFKALHAAFNFSARAYSLRFEAEGKVIAFSGDTALCPGVEAVCVDADLFVCDTSFDKNIVGNVHINTYQIGEISQNGNVKKLLLDHFYPQYQPNNLISEIREKYTGEIIQAVDLTTMDI